MSHVSQKDIDAYHHASLKRPVLEQKIKDKKAKIAEHRKAIREINGTVPLIEAERKAALLATVEDLRVIINSGQVPPPTNFSEISQPFGQRIGAIKTSLLSLPEVIKVLQREVLSIQAELDEEVKV